MSGRVVLALALAVAIVAAVAVVRSLRRVEPTDPAFRVDWRGTPRVRRRAIALAVLRGKAVADSTDAELALRFVEQVKTVRGATRRIARAARVLDVTIAAVAVVVVVALLLTGRVQAGVVILPLVVVALAGLGRERLLGTVDARLERAERANRRVAVANGLGAGPGAGPHVAA